MLEYETLQSTTIYEEEAGTWLCSRSVVSGPGGRARDLLGRPRREGKPAPSPTSRQRSSLRWKDRTSNLSDFESCAMIMNYLDKLSLGKFWLISISNKDRDKLNSLVLIIWRDL